MRLLVSTIPYDGGKSGISVYVREVVRELAAQGHELTLLCEPRVDGREEFDERRIVHAPCWTRRAVFSMLWHLFVLPFWLLRHRNEFDGFVICAANRRVCAWYPIKTTATVHDLANFHIPGKYSRMRMFYLANVLPFFAKRAQRLVAVSCATKADMVRFWKCRDEDVTVLYNGLQTSDFGLQASSGSPKSEVRSLLYISRIEHPGKNHVRLIDAYSRLPRAIAEAHPLMIAGADWKDADVVHAATRRRRRVRTRHSFASRASFRKAKWRISGAGRVSTSSPACSRDSASRSWRRWRAESPAPARTTARWAKSPATPRSRSTREASGKLPPRSNGSFPSRSRKDRHESHAGGIG